MSRFVREAEPPRTPQTDPRQLRRVVAGATVGTALEWYDFFIYGTAAALVFGDLFFDQASRLRHADRVRDFRRRLRRAAVRRDDVRPSRRPHRQTRDADHHDAGDGPVAPARSACCRPTPSIGMWAPILLVTLRVLQGLGAGAEFGGRVDAAGRARAQGAPRLLLLLRPDRRADRPRDRHARVPAGRAAARGPAHGVGLARAVPGRLRADRRRAVGAAAGRGVTGLQGGPAPPDRRQAAGRRGGQALPAQRAGRHRRARLRHRRRLHVRDLHRRLRRRRTRDDARASCSAPWSPTACW